LNTIFSVLKFLVWNTGILISFFLSITANAQYENPDFDRIPVQFLKNPPPKIITPFTVISIGDYDNFNLGTDLGEVHISVNPTNPTNFSACWNAYNIGICSRYTLNGYDWFLNNPVWPGPVNYGDPVSAFDSLGNLYHDNLCGPNYNFVTGSQLAKSVNGGANWLSVFDFSTGVDKEWIACDQTNGPYKNYIYGTITPGNIVRSTDGGATVTQVFSTVNTYGGMMVCIGPNVLGSNNVSGGAVYIVTNTGSLGHSYNYNFFCSTDGGTSWSFKSTQSFAGYAGTWMGSKNAINGLVRTRPYPFLAADNSYGPYRGRLYVVYEKNTPNIDSVKPDIFCHYSTDQGATWSPPLKVNDDVNSQNNNQFFPATWCDKETGKLYVMWSDSRNFPMSDSCEIYATFSTNGGVSFAMNQKISNAKMEIFCPTCGVGGNPAYQGDYNYLGSNKKCAILAWTDFREGTFGSYVGYFPDFGMRVTPESDSIRATGGDVSFYMQVPSVKLYTDTVLVSTGISPVPASGTLTVSYPNANRLTAFPGSVRIRIQTSGRVTPGNYILEVTAKGPNGTPIHKRTANLIVGDSVLATGNEVNIVNRFQLFQNYPNPFNPVTRIDYNLKTKSNVKFTIYDMLGRQVEAMNLGVRQAGKNYVMLNAGNLSSGVYFYKMQAVDFTDIKKMFLLK
jgi:hypothetical protein